MPKIDPRNNAGEYRRKLAIQKPGKVDDGYGHTTDVWADVVNPIWGSITAWKGSISQIADQVFAQEILMIEMRYRPGIDKTMRIIDLNTTPNTAYRIMAINDVNLLHQKLSITATVYA